MQVDLAGTRAKVAVPIHQRLISVLGLIVLLLIAWALSVNRALLDRCILAWGMGLEFVFALFILKTPVGEAMFAALAGAMHMP